MSDTKEKKIEKLIKRFWWCGYNLGLYKLDWWIQKRYKLKVSPLYAMPHRVKQWTKLEWHKLRCRYWNWRLPMDLNSKLQEWQSIDHRKDKSLSGKDFRLWVYLRKLNPTPHKKRQQKKNEWYHFWIWAISQTRL